MENEELTAPESQNIPQDDPASPESPETPDLPQAEAAQQPDAPDPEQPTQTSAPPPPEIQAQQQPAQAPAPPEPRSQDHSGDNGQDQTALVCYGKLNFQGEFLRPKDKIFPAGTKVIVRTERGIEIGRIVLGCCEGCGDKGVSREKWQNYTSHRPQDKPATKTGQILRAASPQDLIDQQRLDQDGLDKARFCTQITKEMGLEMKFVHVEHLFGGDRILFYFKSEKRVDFRKLVRRLAKEYRTRIEMRQVGARDEARILADFERCGRECCCRSFLKALAPVNMKMAKIQKATLDPSKISGRCGRLMCCLRYEHNSYEELRKNLPPRNTLVNTPEGEGIVVDRQILTQLVMVRLPDAKYLAFPLSEISVIPGSSRRQSAQQDRDDQKISDSQSQDNPTDSQGGPRRRRKKQRRKSQRPKQ